MTYPYASLPENLAAFCRVLNAAYGYRIGPRELQDAARALEVTRLGSESAVRHALRPVLGATHEQVRVFDEAFEAFFHPRRDRNHGAPALPEPGTPPLARRRSRSAVPQENRASERGATREPVDVSEIEPTGGEGGENEREGRLRLHYSPREATAPPPELGPVDDAWRAAARAFVRRIEAGRARVWRPARTGPRFDLRRTLRSSLHTGGEVFVTRWQDRPRRRPRFVLLIDGSRSMSTSVQPPLHLAVALAGVTANVDVFVFSTALRRITPDVRRATLGRRHRLPELQEAWGGGTSIGTCLAEFIRRHGERLLARHTVAIIASDGLDTGAPDVLREALARLGRVSAGVVWLNPLVETPGYEPTALGMRIARPYVTTLAWVDGPAGLRQLALNLRLRR